MWFTADNIIESKLWLVIQIPKTCWSCRFIFPTKLGRNVFYPLQGICLRPKKGVRSSTRTPPKVARNISYLAMTNMV